MGLLDLFGVKKGYFRALALLLLDNASPKLTLMFNPGIFFVPLFFFLDNHS
jgi:hypothetical protein